jgi:hypothetical protein
MVPDDFNYAGLQIWPVEEYSFKRISEFYEKPIIFGETICPDDVM